MSSLDVLMTDDFGFRRVLTIAPLLEHWAAVAAGRDEVQAALARELLGRVERAPDLAGAIEDPAAFERHRDLVSALLGAALPHAANPDALGVVVAPFSPFALHATPAFIELGLAASLEEQIRTHGGARTTIAYQYVLSNLYDTPFDVAVPFGLTAADPTTGLPRHFRLTVDARFCRAIAIGDTPELSEEQMDRLLANRKDVALWTQLLPPDRFEIQGFLVFHAAETTELTALADLTAALLKPNAMASPDSMDRLEMYLRTLLRRPDLHLGLIGAERDDMDAIVGAKSVGRSLLLSDGSAPACCNKSASFYITAIEKREPVFIRDLRCCDIPSEYEMHVLELGLRNLLIAPLQIGDRLVGLIELASPNPGDLHALNTSRIRDVLGLFATAMQRMLDDRETRMQAVIKQQYTAIHPSVEWRFREAAGRYIEATDAGEPVMAEAIVFNGVYPLYGLSDVRGSSDHRAAAIQKDLLEQLGCARDVVHEANRARPMPALAELAHRIDSVSIEVAAGLKAGDEQRILEFLGIEIVDTFSQLDDFGSGTAAALARYRASLDADLGFVYRARRDFEQSITTISDTISRYIDAEQERAQAMFPHYFEKFRTDGVDYNIYVGESLQRDGRFQMLYLRNLRLWQLMMMCGIVWELRRIAPELPVPLEVAHLVLVQSAPLAIRFRSEEKQFDVDGAYNIRYEIVKKRIDKARVRGTREHLTQPGRLAIVYSHPREAEEYREYLEFLRSTGYIEGEIEVVELDDLQGASGLEALRVRVAADIAAGDSRPILERIDTLPRSLAAATA